MTGTRPRVVIVGGGFGGLHAARALRRAACDVVVVDRRNHHLFQPLLYQVATASLSPAQIAAPIRKVLSRQRNVEVLLAEAESVDAERRVLHLRDGRVPYDYLVLAPGVTHSYFGRDDWAARAPGLKTIEDATEIRRRFLLAFEAAEREADEPARRAVLTFVVVGAGPTGVEMAGAVAEIARRGLVRDFRRIDTSSARVVLVEHGDRVLGSFPPDLSARARRDLERLGVTVITGAKVTAIDASGVEYTPAGAPPVRLEAGNILWAAGVRGLPLCASLGAPLDRAGRVLVNPDLSVPGRPEVFVIGDAASISDARSARQVPGVCPAAMQMGRHAGRIIRDEIRRGPGAPRPAFRYTNKGELATIGRARAVGVIGWGIGWHLKGFVAWALWALVHITYLIGFRSRILVMIDWMWSYLFFERGARLITGDSTVPLRHARQAEPSADRGAGPPPAGTTGLGGT
ncbi:MAG: NAD(P)/FAD-dependent oxidoreductase [Phycisphaeraceae bacterium]|nr:NAD(P)/FAD-dependent oxidoreductase [Phycisphaeraceae bacterium]